MESWINEIFSIVRNENAAVQAKIDKCLDLLNFATLWTTEPYDSAEIALELRKTNKKSSKTFLQERNQ